MQADIGLIGLAVMGQNLVMNMNDHGYRVAVFNRSVNKVDAFLQGSAKGSQVMGCHTVQEFVSALKRPRRIMLMVKAGEPVDDFIEQLYPLLEPGDIIIDGGNSHFPDTNRRCAYLAKKGIAFLGVGISGGEEGARHGPSIMPGGDSKAWPHVKKIFQDISAKVDGQVPCCDWVGEGGAGHYVKMVHNGIEYGDIQLICEAFWLMQQVLGLSYDEIGEIFSSWNQRELDSYLIEIASHIFKTKDQDGSPLLSKILDVAGQKGTGKWTAMSALDTGVPVTLIGEAVFARCLSALKNQRIAASRLFQDPKRHFAGDRKAFIEDIFHALYASKIISYTQGYMLMTEASKSNQWNLNYGAIALMWRGGCIIRSIFLGKIKEAFDRNAQLPNLLLDPFFHGEIVKSEAGWRRVVAEASLQGVPIPCFSTALSFFDGYRSNLLPANLIQALRDYFGAHTYERVDQPRGSFFHTNWTGTGGTVSSSSYSV